MHAAIAAIAAKVSELSCAPVFCSYCSTSEIENTKYVPEFITFRKFIPPKSLNLGTNTIGQPLRPGFLWPRAIWFQLSRPKPNAMTDASQINHGGFGTVQSAGDNYAWKSCCVIYSPANGNSAGIVTTTPRASSSTIGSATTATPRCSGQSPT